MKLLKITLPIFVLTLLLHSCGNDTKVDDDGNPITTTKSTKPAKRKTFNPEYLNGKWILTEATMNRIPTPRFDSVYFEFIEENILKTNILGLDEEGTFTLKNKTMTQKTDKTIDYQIKKLVSDSLVMSLNASGKDFKITLQKK